MQTDYKSLAVWKYAFELALNFYEVIALLPECESRNIADQMRRAVTSLPLNIAEGASSASSKVFINHLKYAYASAQELEVLLMLCLKLKYVDEARFRRLFDDLDRFKCATFKLTVNTERKDAQKRFGFLGVGPREGVGADVS